LSEEIRQIYRLIYWTTDNPEGDPEKPIITDPIDMTGHPPGHPMDNTELSRKYQRLYEDPGVYKLQIWKFFAGFERRR